ncbi:MAG: hypothetical protein CTY20_06910 [Hyphomicrobium sp.]|nr:MAG: hypothetical protein CTY20_06910 [Hyphomicrobium sp.]
MIDSGIPRETIADDLRLSLRQVDGIRARHKHEWRSQEEMLKKAHTYAIARSRARKRNCLTWEECLANWEDNGRFCALTGIKFSNKLINKKGKVLRYPFRPSLDRKDPTKGYTVANTRIVTQWANFARGEWSDATFRSMCRAAADYSESSVKKFR